MDKTNRKQSFANFSKTQIMNVMCPSPRNIATMGLDNFVKIRSALTRSKHKEVKQYKVPFQANLWYFQNFLSFLTWKHASLMSSDTDQYPSELKSRACLTVFILK